ncbi:hypothetical protein [Polynucleobacter sp. UK-Gri1-W3]|uniref:antitoxin VbhA family protein n=1 Tax=Polynucleobacter sp. UK-Gri1-W3 TaxID=1819737 RepID=UPI001C0AC355|nr:antitoxin VbhA family protein [Polynucleobacter sp. UK-Gri1-W3]
MPAKIVTTHQLRQNIVCNAIASARIEGIALATQFEQKLTDYINGKKSIAQFIEQTKQSYIKSTTK